MLINSLWLGIIKSIVLMELNTNKKTGLNSYPDWSRNQSRVEYMSRVLMELRKP
jgi:hypothetical protein